MLPAAFPNLLANGSQGIAVGMATSIPPHNAAELCDAALHLISQPERHLRAADAVRAGAGSADRRHHRRHAVRHGRDLPHRPRLVPRARPLGQGGSRPRQLAHRRHRDPLCGAEVAPDREDRRAAAGEEAAAARRRARRIRGGHPRRAGAARQDGRSDHPDGIAVQAHRAREPHPDERERARRRQGAEGAGPRRVPARMARPSPRGAGPPLAASGSPPSTGAWRSWAACSSSISTSTG